MRRTACWAGSTSSISSAKLASVRLREPFGQSVEAFVVGSALFSGDMPIWRRVRAPSFA